MFEARRRSDMAKNKKRIQPRFNSNSQQRIPRAKFDDNNRPNIGAKFRCSLVELSEPEEKRLSHRRTRLATYDGQVAIVYAYSSGLGVYARFPKMEEKEEIVPYEFCKWQL